MEHTWFEMTEIRKRRFDTAVWIPLRASEKAETGRKWYLGYRSEFFGAGSLAVPLKKREAAERLDWMDLGLMHDHCGGCAYRSHGKGHGRYIPADEYGDERLKGAVSLVMSQRGNSAEPSTWHIHPDFVITLGLKREGDVWVAMDEGYIEVVRLKSDHDNHPRLLEVRAEHLKDNRVQEAWRFSSRGIESEWRLSKKSLTSNGRNRTAPTRTVNAGKVA